jgi:proteasome lid subunit RPN8/RPN11
MRAPVIGAAAARAVSAEVAAWGARDCETGGFLLGRPGETELAVVALSGGAGIRRRSEQFRVSAAALGQLFNYAATQELSVLAGFHSHRRSAFLSETDLADGLNVEGFISTVVPQYWAPTSEPDGWRWWCYCGEWKEIAPPTTAARELQVVRFDEDGARES